jgi:hypothetical protein
MIIGGEYIAFESSRFEYASRFGDVSACFRPVLAQNGVLIDPRFCPKYWFSDPRQNIGYPIRDRPI